MTGAVEDGEGCLPHENVLPQLDHAQHDEHEHQELEGEHVPLGPVPSVHDLVHEGHLPALLLAAVLLGAWLVRLLGLGLSRALGSCAVGVKCILEATGRLLGDVDAPAHYPASRLRLLSAGPAVGVAGSRGHQDSGSGNGPLAPEQVARGPRDLLVLALDPLLEAGSLFGSTVGGSIAPRLQLRAEGSAGVGDKVLGRGGRGGRPQGGGEEGRASRHHGAAALLGGARSRRSGDRGGSGEAEEEEGGEQCGGAGHGGYGRAGSGPAGRARGRGGCEATAAEVDVGD
ncbi:hypothetical protein B0J12DRAFT_653693 [Macrophomina phaseolina]|uniref:Uncharacterized protein n=1 Tax=Macrophomina phaseolina TaxID=35725 RepID=A0ABQ8GJM5_9PEZI|nr:hypothetical protein B0J12DRAFT_653693 [Macrophomina phaseolina]